MRYFLILLALLCLCSDKEYTIKAKMVTDTVKVYDTVKVEQTIREDVLPDYQLCNKTFRITGKIKRKDKYKYTYIVTDGCSDSIGGWNGFQMHSDNEYEINDKLYLTEEF